MNKELEELIDYAIADGTLTEKKKELLDRKAKELGVDQDEFEMVLEGKLHKINKQEILPTQSFEKKSNKEGDIKKCPSCGASVESFTSNCKECGHEFRNTQANSKLQELLDKMGKIDTLKIDSPKILMSKLNPNIQKMQIENERTKMKSELILNFPIPNNKEDIIEFLSVSFSQGKDSSPKSYLGDGYSTSGAWGKKAEECIMKAKVMFRNDPDFLAQIISYDKDLKSNVKSKNMIKIFIIVIVAIILIIVYGGIFVSEALKHK